MKCPRPDLWFGYDDVPTIHTSDLPFPVTALTRSGLWVVIDERTTGDDPCTAEDAPRLWVCIMPRAHDTPHMPATRELQDQARLIVRSIGHAPS